MMDSEIGKVRESQEYIYRERKRERKKFRRREEDKCIV